MDLNAGRSTGMSVNPISWSEIDAYSSGMQLAIKPWERRILRDMDIAALSIIRQHEKSRADGKEPDVVVKDQPMTGALFKAMFGKG